MRVSLEASSVCLDAINQGGGQCLSWLDAGGLEIFGQNGRGRANARADIHKWGGDLQVLRVMVDHHFIGELPKELVVVGLSVHHHALVMPRDHGFLQLHHGKSQEPDHSEVVKPSNGAYDADGAGLNLAPEKAFDRQCGADGIGIGVDGDQNVVFVLELGVEVLQPIFWGTVPFGRAGFWACWLR